PVRRRYVTVPAGYTGELPIVSLCSGRGFDDAKVDGPAALAIASSSTAHRILEAPQRVCGDSPSRQGTHGLTSSPWFAYPGGGRVERWKEAQPMVAWHVRLSRRLRRFRRRRHQSGGSVPRAPPAPSAALSVVGTGGGRDAGSWD